MNSVRSFTVRALPFAALALAGCLATPPGDTLEPAPHIISFTSSAAEVAAGGNVTLSWAVEGAKSIKIEEVKLGAVSGVSGDTGMVQVAITDDALFVLTIRNDRGQSDTAVAVVHVGAATGDILFTGLPNTISAGEHVTLAWAVPGASAVTLTASPGGAIDVAGQTASGSVLVSPTVNTTYTLTAGTRTATTAVQVKPTLLSFSASTLSADAGSTVTLSWETANATRVQLNAPGRGTLVDEMDAARIANGSFDDVLPTQVDPGQFFPYELVVTGAGVMLKQSVIISVSGNPSIVTFTAPALSRDPALGAFPDGGSPPANVHLAWTTTEASRVTLSANGSEFYEAPLTLVASGSLDVPAPAVDTTYVLTARGARGGIISSSKLVDVVGLPTVSLAANPSTVMGGASTSFDWTGTFIHGITLSSQSLGAVVVNPLATDTGSIVRYPGTSEQWTLTATNGVGDSISANATVTVTNPILLNVAETGVLRQGQNISVSWTSAMMNQVTGLPHDGIDARASAFDDISTTGTRLTFPATGNIVAPITTTFRTTLFGQRVGAVINVSQNGYLAFGDVNGANSSDEALPTAKLEPLSIAPYWESLTASGVFWQLKTVNGVDWLIVQWNTATARFQARISAAGRVDFDYPLMPSSISGHTGITGLRPGQFVSATAVADAGLTFFGPRSSPVTLRALQEGTVAGQLEVTPNNFLPLLTTIGPVVSPAELAVTEVMPRSRVTDGNWVELRNSRNVPLDLTGWNFALADAGTVALMGTVPANGVLVLGTSTDPSLNDDAGVQVALSGFDFGGLSSLVFGRGGAQSTVALSGADAGQAINADLGPLRPSAPSTCLANNAYGAQTPLQLGTPGRDKGCGFPYSLAPTTFGYYDISGTGTALITGTISFDDSIQTFSLAAHPVPVFGVTRTSVQINTNGWLTFDTAAGTAADYIDLTNPSSSDSNTVLAVYADDLDESLLVTPGNVYAKYVMAGEDPFAAAPHWIFQWHHYSSFFSPNDDLNFQAKVFDDGTIEYHYARMLSGSSTAYGSGSNATTWLENPAGTQALTINVSSTNPGISPYSAFRFTPR